MTILIILVTIREHTKQNIPYKLAKRIIVFVSDEVKINERLPELKRGYFLVVIP